MPTKNYNRQTQKSPVVAVLLRPVKVRLSRIENLLLEVRHEQDVVLKRLTKAQAQLDALTGTLPSVAHLANLFKLRQ
jgi:hypothetical protein